MHMPVTGYADNRLAQPLLSTASCAGLHRKQRPGSSRIHRLAFHVDAAWQ